MPWFLKQFLFLKLCSLKMKRKVCLGSRHNLPLPSRTNTSSSFYWGILGARGWAAQMPSLLACMFPRSPAARRPGPPCHPRLGSAGSGMGLQAQCGPVSALGWVRPTRPAPLSHLCLAGPRTPQSRDGALTWGAPAAWGPLSGCGAARASCCPGACSAASIPGAVLGAVGR